MSASRLIISILTSAIITLFLNENVVAQEVDKENLFKRREQILKDIKLTNKLIQSTSKKRGRNLNKVRLIESKIRKREALINTYNTEISILDNKLNDRAETIDKLESELKIQRELYANLIYYSYKNHDHFSIALYLLASKSMNQFYLRKKYLDQIREAREEKIVMIRNLQGRIKYEIVELNSEKEEKSKAIEKINQEKSNLANEKVGKVKAVKVLSEEESKLKKQLLAKKKIEEEIAKKLEEIIRAEAKKGKFAKLTPEEKLVSTNFENNRGRLPWPTVQGVITERFGEHNHPVIKNVKTRNSGVDITTLTNEVVRCVFIGEVTKIFSIKGTDYTVVVKHGTYYTVYHNIYDVKVNVGDKLNTKDIIGRVSKSKDGENAIVHFQIWKGFDKLNPELWLSK